MKKAVLLTLGLSLVLAVGCGRRNNNNSANNTCNNQNVSYDQYGRPLQTCINGQAVNPMGNNTGNFGYGYTGVGYNTGYGYNTGFGGSIGTTGNPCAVYMQMYGAMYMPAMINGQWMCVLSR